MEFKSAYDDLLSTETKEVLQNSDKRALKHHTSEFYHRICKQAENILHVEFPKKLVELDDLVSVRGFRELWV